MWDVMESQQQMFLKDVTGLVWYYLPKIEALFGDRRSKFTFGKITRSTASNGVPQTDFPCGYDEETGSVVDIQLGHSPYDNQSLNQSAWQIAHECVHLLDPCCKGQANVLEEGLATWFQDEEKYHPGFVKTYIRGNCAHPYNYSEAKALVVRCMPNLPGAVREIRSRRVRLKDFEPSMLKPLLPHVDHFVVDRLCAPFATALDV